MFKLSHRLSILRASLLGCLVVAVLSTASYFIINSTKDTNALTQENDEVDVLYEPGDGGMLVYGNSDPDKPNSSWNTRFYNVKNTVTNKRYDAYCAQPSKGSPKTDPSDPDDVYKAKKLSNSSRDGNGGKIKLIMYLQQNNASHSIFNPIEDSAAWGSDREHRRYIFTHAIIGALYETPGDYKGLNSTEKNQVNTAITTLTNLINNNDNLWKKANTYQLYRTQTPKNTQDVVWLEATGDIIVKKCDADFGAEPCNPQGNATFDGTVFELYDGTTKIDSKTLTGGANTVTFSMLDSNKRYTIKEISNSYYDVDISTQNAYPGEDGEATVIRFDNYIKRGSIKVEKKDKDVQETCTPSSQLITFAGTKFQLFNKSTRSIFYNGTAYAPDPQSNNPIAEVTFTEGQCNATFDELPYGTYELKEVAAGTGYVLDETPRLITIPTDNNANITYTFENQPIRGDLKFVKKDPVNQAVIPNAVFEISSINNGYIENHIVVSNEEGIVDTSLIAHSINTNGYDELYHASEENSITYAGYGTWFGVDRNNQPIPVRDDVGALPYGTYLIQELKCDAFLFCEHTNNEKKTFSITEHGVIVLLDGTGEWNNECAEFSLSTTATDEKDGDHYFEAGEDTVIKDVVTYCAKKNYTFTIKGTLMDKETNQPLLINGEPVEQSVEVTPTDQDCGTTEMLFPINTSDLAGKSIVVFEKLYYKNEEKASHEDINDEAQTVTVVSLGTVAVDNEDNDQYYLPGEETVIKDTVSYCTAAGQTYTITGVLMDKTTGNPILVNGEPVTQSVTFTPEQNCGTAEMVFPAIDTTAIAGHPIVVYETLYKVIPSEPSTLEKVISHEDPNDKDQTVYPITISTTVQPNEDGTKIFPLDSDITVTDIVHYCLKPGTEYTVKGIVMDKSTGNGLLVNSALVEESITFTPTEYCGEIPMYYTFNTKDLTGAKLIVFESLYEGDKLLIEHKDFDNELESFEIDINPPDTGFVTKHTEPGASHQELLIIAALAFAPIVIYSTNRFQARKRFFNK